ncbi:hypothetical protein C5167_023367, partial [Papaver somniferum]
MTYLNRDTQMLFLVTVLRIHTLWLSSIANMGSASAIRSSTPSIKGSASKPKKTIGRVKVQVRKVKMDLDSPNGCTFLSLRPSKIKVEALRHRLSNLRSTFSSGWQAIRRVRVQPQVPASGSFSRHSLAYLHASSQSIKQVSGLLKIGATTLRSRSEPYEVVHETYTCILRLKNSNDDETVHMQPGSNSAGDDLFLEVQDSKGKYCGSVIAQMATFMEEPGDKVRWLPFHPEPEHELVGRIQLCINYSTSIGENVHLKDSSSRPHSLILKIYSCSTKVPGMEELK